MIYNGAITVYRIQDGGGFERCFIPECFASENKGASASQTGFADASAFVAYIPVKYAALAPQTAAKDIVVKGNCPIAFDNTSPKTISESLKALRASGDMYTVKSIGDRLYGFSLRHIKVVAE